LNYRRSKKKKKKKKGQKKAEGRKLSIKELKKIPAFSIPAKWKASTKYIAQGLKTHSVH
jgi:hypothetical protein